jgi:hypothetical protein
VTGSELALELPGDWSSARLLVRILYTIGSDWELTEVGLVDQERGDACTLRMRGPDGGLVERFRAWEDPAFPSFMDEDYESLGTHKAVVTVRPGEGLVHREAGLALLRCGAALVDAGARAVALPGCQLAHSADRWQQLARLADQDPGGPGEVTALVRGFVRPAVRDGAGWRTVGLGPLGLRDVVVDASIGETYAFEMQQALCHRLLTGPDLSGDEVLQMGQRWPQVHIRARSDAANPLGVWHLQPG